MFLKGEGGKEGRGGEGGGGEEWRRSRLSQMTSSVRPEWPTSCSEVLHINTQDTNMAYCSIPKHRN